jgi:hypothetical protein
MRFGDQKLPSRKKKYGQKHVACIYGVAFEGPPKDLDPQLYDAKGYPDGSHAPKRKGAYVLMHLSGKALTSS